MITKQEFLDHMADLYGKDQDFLSLYKTFKSISKIKDKAQLKELFELTKMDKKKRLLYRHSLAAYGREFTPLQLDQYLSTIEYAISNME
jgi:hypothetical protein